MPRRTRATALAVTAAVVVALAGNAHATIPLMTDPSGDASAAPCFATDLVSPAVCALVMPHLPSAPSIDVIAADITSGATSLDFTIDVVDLGAPSATEQHSFVVTSTGGHGFSVGARRDPSGATSAVVYGGPSEGSYTASVPVSYDDTVDRITMTVSFTVLSAATGTTVQSGTVFGGLSVWTAQATTAAVVTASVGPSDEASTTAAYTV